MAKHIGPQHGWPEEYVQRYQQAGYWRGETFGTMLRERALEHPQRIAVAGNKQRLSYEQLDRDASTIGAGLLAGGFNAGDRIVVHLPNIPEFVSVIFGMFRVGIVPVYALPAHRITEIEHFVNSSGARAYLCAAEHGGFDYCSLADTLKERCPDLEQVFVIGESSGRHTSLQALMDGAADTQLPATAAAPQDIAFLQISGGTTGLSKLIPRTHDDYIYTLRESARICGLDADSVMLCALPMAHNFPMSSPGFLGTLYAGGRVVLSPTPTPQDCFELIASEKVTQCSLVPPLLMLWLDAAERSKPDLSTLRVMQVGGAKLSAAVARRVKPIFGVTLQQVFGMAEGLVNYTRLDDDQDTIMETQGRPISPDDEILILDDNGVPVPPGQAGHLLTRGPYTIRGYYNNPGANQRSFEDGYYRTGDIVKLTPAGYLVVQGRAGDHINRAGEKISAEEVENYLLSHPGVFDAAVVSVPDPYLGERSCAFIIPKNEKPRAIELKKWVREQGIAEFKVPDQIVFVDTFSETAVGKISRKTLRAQLRAQLEQTQHNS
ncbi:AMP-binding protein [Pusillimonas sp. MFBS29]|uniref:(2,3-dihydroxybenzoyl)adenylate synthase n=1 Tax=Pusillimonas sp. MFBS29 TaxID=2886690 RepID=UPI001D109D86|nr:AMP-binding protein [Pusillimonas sp. MFBS29]MCC2595446.1 AMP-binding protein [Pusillimonas sp. MFBS29]